MRDKVVNITPYIRDLVVHGKCTLEMVHVTNYLYSVRYLIS